MGPGCKRFTRGAFSAPPFRSSCLFLLGACNPFSPLFFFSLVSLRSPPWSLGTCLLSLCIQRSFKDNVFHFLSSRSLLGSLSIEVAEEFLCLRLSFFPSSCWRIGALFLVRRRGLLGGVDCWPLRWSGVESVFFFIRRWLRGQGLVGRMSRVFLARVSLQASWLSEQPFCHSWVALRVAPF